MEPKTKPATEQSGYRAGLARVVNDKAVSLERLFAFYEVASEGGFDAAARGDENKKRHYQRQIRELNAHYCKQLASDNDVEWQLLTQGRALYEIVRPFAQAMIQFNDVCFNEYHISIGAGDRVMQWYLIPRLQAMQEELLDHRIEIFNLSAGEIHWRIRNSTLDFGIVRASDVSGGRSELLDVAFDYALFVKESVAGKHDANWVLHKAPLAIVSKYQADFCDGPNRKLNVKLICSTFPQAWRAVASGYAAILPVSAFGKEERTDVVQLPLPFELPGLARERSFCLIWSPALEVRRDFERVISTLKAHLCKQLTKDGGETGSSLPSGQPKEKEPGGGTLKAKKS
jgi:DNA-binding transcriptional LysR family regulator